MIITLTLQPLFPAGMLPALHEQIVTHVVGALASAARDKWVQLAVNNLHRTKADYLAGLQPVQMGSQSASIALLGDLPNAIEKGTPALDMHDTLLGPNVPVASGPGQRGKREKSDGNGYYRAIPFRHAVPASAGITGQPMGSAYQGHAAFAQGKKILMSGGARVGNAQQLGQAVYAQAKKLKGTTGMPGGPVQYGGRLPAGLAPKLRDHHATDIYAGMIKSRKTYEKATQSQYTTFRTISTGSPGWQRKATEGKFFARQVEQYIQRIAPKAFEDYLKGVLGT